MRHTGGKIEVFSTTIALPEPEVGRAPQEQWRRDLKLKEDTRKKEGILDKQKLLNKNIVRGWQKAPEGATPYAAEQRKGGTGTTGKTKNPTKKG